jgi:NADPH2:quinone reductase
MHAVRVHAPGGAEAMVYEEVPDPTPGPGEAVVRIEAAGVNFIDVYFRTGHYKGAAFPLILGQEAAGVVESVAAGVTEVAPGDRVAYTNVHGAYAEKAAVPAARLVKLPEGVTTRQAAAAMLQGMTAHYLSNDTYPLKPGDVCLLHAAAGGVGLLLCQMAKLRGARVLGTVGSEEKAKLAREAGADEVIRYKEQDFVAEARRLTDGNGVSVVYDGIGKDTFERGLDALARRGMMVLFGGASGPVAPVDPLVLAQKGSLYLTRPTLTHYIVTRQELVERATQVLRWIADGQVKLLKVTEYPLAQAAEAHRALEAGQTTGKLLLIP